MSRWLIGIPVFWVLLSGTFVGLANKALYDYKAQGSCGYHGFEKPYFLTFAMFIGEFLCLFVYTARQWWQRESSKIWLSRVCSWCYTYDADLARRRREKEREALAHGIEPYAAPTGFEEAVLSDEEPDVGEDEEKSLLGSSPSARHVTAAHPQLQRVGGTLDQDLLDLHLTEEEQRRRREANAPSKFVYLGLCLFDLTATATGGIGLLYIDASSNQMLRGSSVVFTALMSKVILRRALSWKQWAGIAAVCAGLALVGLCGLLRADHTLTPASTEPHNQVSTSGAALGLILVLASSALNSIQNVFEELLVKRAGEDAIDALEIVGWEGFWGALITGCIVLPIVQYLPGSNCGSIESTQDSWMLLKNSSMILWLTLGFTVSLSFMNAYSVELSKVVSATFRQLINALRVVFIWMISILMFYVWTHRSMGEAWDVYSYLQLGGFTLLLGGTLIYGTKEVTEGAEGAIPVDPNAPDTPKEDPRKQAKTKSTDAPASPTVDEYDENGNRISTEPDPDKDGVAIHIGTGRDRNVSKRTSNPQARSPGIETLSLPDVRDQSPPSHSAPGGGSSRRAKASIMMDGKPSDL